MLRHTLVSHLARIINATPRRPLRVGVDGVDASGKTILADELAGEIGRQAIRSSVDLFNRPRSLRYQRGRLSPEGYYYDAHDHGALTADLLAPLGPAGSRRVRLAAFDLDCDKPAAAQFSDVGDDAILVFDGVFLQRPELAGSIDLVFFVHCPFEEVLRRARIRDRDHFGTMDALETAYRRRYIAGQQIYIRDCTPILRADIVVDNSDPAAPGLISDQSTRRQLRAEALAFIP